MRGPAAVLLVIFSMCLAAREMNTSFMLTAKYGPIEIEDLGREFGTEDN
jgi:hypothetical protein